MQAVPAGGVGDQCSRRAEQFAMGGFHLTITITSSSSSPSSATLTTSAPRVRAFLRKKISSHFHASSDHIFMLLAKIPPFADEFRYWGF